MILSLHWLVSELDQVEKGEDSLSHAHWHQYLEMIPTLEAFKYIHADIESCTCEPPPKYHLAIQLQESLGKADSPLPTLRGAAKEGTKVRAGAKH